MKCIYFFGDSITLGVNDRNMQGWTGLLGAKTHDEMEKSGSSFPSITVYNLGVRKDTSDNIRKRWEAELDARILEDADMMTIFCFGAVDMAAPTGTINVPVPESVRNAREILKKARKKSKVMLLSPPPVKNPVHTGRIMELSEAYQAMCNNHEIPFYDMLQELKDSNCYMESLEDGIHPSSTGCEEFAKILSACPALSDWLTGV